MSIIFVFIIFIISVAVILVIVILVCKVKLNKNEKCFIAFQLKLLYYKDILSFPFEKEVAVLNMHL